MQAHRTIANTLMTPCFSRCAQRLSATLFHSRFARDAAQIRLICGCRMRWARHLCRADPDEGNIDRVPAAKRTCATGPTAVSPRAFPSPAVAPATTRGSGVTRRRHALNDHERCRCPGVGSTCGKPHQLVELEVRASQRQPPRGPLLGSARGPARHRRVVRGIAQRARKDSNLRPTASEAAALSS